MQIYYYYYYYLFFLFLKIFELRKCHAITVQDKDTLYIIYNGVSKIVNIFYIFIKNTFNFHYEKHVSYFLLFFYVIYVFVRLALSYSFVDVLLK